MSGEDFEKYVFDNDDDIVNPTYRRRSVSPHHRSRKGRNLQIKENYSVKLKCIIKSVNKMERLRQNKITLDIPNIKIKF